MLRRGIGCSRSSPGRVSSAASCVGGRVGRGHPIRRTATGGWAIIRRTGARPRLVTTPWRALCLGVRAARVARLARWCAGGRWPAGSTGLCWLRAGRRLRAATGARGSLARHPEGDRSRPAAPPAPFPLGALAAQCRRRLRQVAAMAGRHAGGRPWSLAVDRAPRGSECVSWRIGGPPAQGRPRRGGWADLSPYAVGFAAHPLPAAGTCAGARSVRHAIVSALRGSTRAAGPRARARRTCHLGGEVFAARVRRARGRPLAPRGATKLAPPSMPSPRSAANARGVCALSVVWQPFERTPPAHPGSWPGPGSRSAAARCPSPRSATNAARRPS
jgi:hypothetical protein